MESITVKTNFLPSYNFNKLANLKYLYHDTLIINNDTINVLKKYKENENIKKINIRELCEEKYVSIFT